MADTALDIIQALKKQLETEDFTLYSLKDRDDQPTLIMYNTKKKQFAVIAFSPDEPGAYSQVNVWLHIAESKAEVFGNLDVADYRVFKDVQDMWQIEQVRSVRTQE